MARSIGTRLLLLLAFAQHCDCCEVRNVSGDATVSNCTHQSAVEFLQDFNASRWKQARGLSLDFSFNALGAAYAAWVRQIPWGESMHDGLSSLTNLESFGLNLHGNLMTRLPAGEAPVFGDPFKSLPRLRSLAFNYSGNPADMLDASNRRVEWTTYGTLNVAGLFATTAATEINLDVSHTNIQFPVELFSMAAPNATWPLQSLILDVTGTAITKPVVLFTANTTKIHHSYAFRDSDACHDPDMETHFARLSYVNIRAAGLRLGDANIRDLAIILARLPALDTLALDLSGNNISDVGLKDLHGASQRMKQLRSLSLKLHDNHFANTTAGACLSEWTQRLHHVEVQTDEIASSHGARPLTSRPSHTDPTSTTSLPSSTKTSVSATTTAPTKASTVTSPPTSTALVEQTSSSVKATEGSHASQTASPTEAIEESPAPPPQKQKPRHQQRPDGTQFHPQMALMCLCCIMMAAGYVWWKRSEDPQAFAGWLPDWNGPPGPHWTATPGGPDEYPGSTEVQSLDSARTPVFSGDMAGQYLEMPLTQNRHGDGP